MFFYINCVQNIKLLNWVTVFVDRFIVFSKSLKYIVYDNYNEEIFLEVLVTSNL